MSAVLLSASENNASLQGTTVGGSKPLHRFIQGQPKSIGIVVLVLGSSFIITSIVIMQNTFPVIWTVIPSSFTQGILFIICGILYIVTEHNPTKKTVTISLALSIVTLLVACWTILHIMPSIIHYHHYYPYETVYELDDNMTEVPVTTSYEALGVSVEAIYLFYSIVGAIIFILMSTFAGIALRSTKSQAIVMMTTMPIEPPVDNQAQEEVR